MHMQPHFSSSCVPVCSSAFSVRINLNWRREQKQLITNERARTVLSLWGFAVLRSFRPTLFLSLSLCLPLFFPISRSLRIRLADCGFLIKTNRCFMVHFTVCVVRTTVYNISLKPTDLFGFLLLIFCTYEHRTQRKLKYRADIDSSPREQTSWEMSKTRDHIKLSSVHTWQKAKKSSVYYNQIERNIISFV